MKKPRQCASASPSLACAAPSLCFFATPLPLEEFLVVIAAFLFDGEAPSGIPRGCPLRRSQLLLRQRLGAVTPTTPTAAEPRP